MHASLRPAAGLFLPLLLALPALVGQDGCQEPPTDPTPMPITRIMPLGDSITDGYNVPGGYRISLEDGLLASNIPFSFVGSLRNGPPELQDRDHEGHNGWRIDEISASVESWLLASRPDVVLLLIGTNDVLQDYWLEQAPDRLDRLVGQIELVNPWSTVVVASIPPLADSVDDTQARLYNSAIADRMAARAALGEAVWWVDMHSALNATDLADGIHPTRRGYDKLGAVWEEALVEILGAAPVW